MEEGGLGGKVFIILVVLLIVTVLIYMPSVIKEDQAKRAAASSEQNRGVGRDQEGQEIRDRGEFGQSSSSAGDSSDSQTAQDLEALAASSGEPSLESKGVVAENNAEATKRFDSEGLDNWAKNRMARAEDNLKHWDPSQPLLYDRIIDDLRVQRCIVGSVNILTRTINWGLDSQNCRPAAPSEPVPRVARTRNQPEPPPVQCSVGQTKGRQGKCEIP